MSIIWRYLLSQYLKVLFISVMAFVAILLTTRLDEIAKFASLGNGGRYVFYFILYQIPYILPIAFPISCLIASISLFQRLSTTHELTALRACGLSLRQITAPILFAAAYLSLSNFYIVSEVATESHMKAKRLESELKSINPLLLIQNARLLKMKGLHAEILKNQELSEEKIEDVVIAFPNRSKRRLNLILASKLSLEGPDLIGQNISTFSSFPNQEKHSFDDLFLENTHSLKTDAKEIIKVFGKDGWKLNEDHLKLSLLLVRCQDLNIALKNAKMQGLKEEEKENRNKLYGCFTEISRRLSVAFAPFTYSLMGAAFGMSIGRYRSRSKLLFAIALASLYLCAFFIAKNMHDQFITATMLYSIPHIIIVIASVWTLKKVTRGVEA